MAKKIINLLIEKEPESKEIKRLKKLTPYVSIAFLVIFVLLHFISLIYVRININDYNKVNSQIKNYEARVAAAKSSEAVYITTVGVLEKIKNILNSNTKVIDTTLPVLFQFQNSDIVIDNITIDNQGQVTFLVKTTSINTLNSFVNELKKSEAEYDFSEVKAASILRESDGSYTFTVTLVINYNKRHNAEK